jgi:hypothetical protein
MHPFTLSLSLSLSLSPSLCPSLSMHACMERERVCMYA